MKRVIPLLLLLSSFVVSAELEALKEFFNRKGYVVEKLDDKVIIDLGKDRVKPGEVFKVVKEGKEIVHPVTGEVLGKREEEVGRVEITDTKDKFSFARILEDKGIDKGDRVEVYHGEVCFSGSEEGFFKVSSLVRSLKKGEGCDYLVREFEDGYGVEYKGTAVAFFSKPKPKVVVKEKEEEKTPKGFKLSAKPLMSFEDIPLSADLCPSEDEHAYLSVLFEEKVVFYEMVNGEPNEIAKLRLPAGYPVSVQCVRFGEEDPVVLVNMVSGNSASSTIIRFVGDTPVIERGNIPFMMGVLDKEDPTNTFVGQSFDSRDGWGRVVRLKYEGKEVEEVEPFKVPEGFRIDSAVKKGDLIAFTDGEGYLRVYRGEELLLSEKDFGGSYTSATLEGAYEDEDEYTFNPRHFTFSVGGKTLLGFVKNVTSPVNRFLGVSKFTEGELYALLEDKEPTLKILRGKKFEEAVQSVIPFGDGRILVITGRKGTLPTQNSGDLYEVKIEPIF